MTTYYPKPLPRPYGCAQLDPPDERIPICTCGHSWEDHEDADDRKCAIRKCDCIKFEESDGIDPRY